MAKTKILKPKPIKLVSYFHKLSIALLLIFLSSCRYQNHVVQINSAEPKLEFKQYYSKKLGLKVVDRREDKQFIGFRVPISIWNFEEQYKKPNYFLGYDNDYHYKISNLTNNQDLSDIVRQKLSTNLKSKGFKIERFSVNQIKVEILELSFVPAFYRNSINSRIKITASNKNHELEKIYEKNIISYRPMVRVLLMGPFDFGASGGYYDDIISECLNHNIEQIVSDDPIWNFLQ